MSFSDARMREKDALNRCESSGIRVGEEAERNTNQNVCVRGSSERGTAIIGLRAPSGARDPSKDCALLSHSGGFLPLHECCCK